MGDHLRIEDHPTDGGAVRVLTLDRPQALNAFDTPLYLALAGALDAAASDDSVHVVVVTGEGRAFSAGQDLKEMTAMATAGPDVEIVSGFPALLDALAAFDKPLIAAVNGLAIGIGFTMLPHCDLVLVSTEARLRVPFAELGVPPEAASSLLLPLVMGQRGVAALLTGEWVSADDAVASGLALSAHAPEQLLGDALALGRRIASGPLASLRAIRTTMRAAKASQIAEARQREEALFADMLTHMTRGDQWT